MSAMQLDEVEEYLRLFLIDEAGFQHFYPTTAISRLFLALKGKALDLDEFEVVPGQLSIRRMTKPPALDDFVRSLPEPATISAVISWAKRATLIHSNTA
jgi:hypothetical protein